MKILVCGAGAIGSSLIRNLVPDLKGNHEITVLDMDTVEERNVTPGTQWYSPDQIGMPKVEALQFNVFKWFEREIEIFHGNITDWIGQSPKQDLIVDCFDNHEAREIIQTQYKDFADVLHIGFSDKFTFAVEWAENYAVPSDITTGMDICEMPGAAGFVASVGSLGALVVENYLEKGEKMQILGGKYLRSLVR